MNCEVKTNPITCDLLKALGKLAHEVQKERGYTALFVDSEGKICGPELVEQYKKTDQAYLGMEKQMDDGVLGVEAHVIDKVRVLLDFKTSINSQRAQVIALEGGFAKAINYYTYSVLCAIIDTCIEVAYTVVTENPSRVSAYSNFVQWKERAGRERAWGVHGFCSQVFKNREFTARILELIDEQKAYEKTFMSVANREQAEIVNTVLSDHAIRQVDELHKEMQTFDQSIDFSDFSPMLWFSFLTEKIDRMRVAEGRLVENMFEQKIPTPEPIEEPKTKPHLALIRALPIFAKLDDKELGELLSHSQVRTYEKGKTLFLQGESLNRYYLILNGWVKVFKGTESGEEAVLQMLSAGDSLMEAASLLGIPSVVSAQVVLKTNILSIPAPIMRQMLMKNQNFAMNMIGNLSMRSQGLIRQIEQSRLKTATERVGWFLLRIALEQNGGRVNSIYLPYDKTTIASYLDMRPETFSRTLKKFREKGFRIHNDRIIKPHPQALCNFCDHALAKACIYATKDACPLPIEDL